jgi:methionyl aminopeptidase
MALIKTAEQIDRIKQSAKLLASILKYLHRIANVGTNLLELESLARREIAAAGATPAFLGYNQDGAAEPFPFALCASLNNVIVHGRPHDYLLRSGDILKLDLGINWRGGISDAAISIPIGEITQTDKKLIRITQESLWMGIKKARPGRTTGDIGHAIENTIIGGGFFVVDGLTGHGVGEKVHEEPTIYNFGESGRGVELRPGMVLALEPMAATGSSKIKQLPDESYATYDGSNSAHFEHTVLITKKGAVVLTG